MAVDEMLLEQAQDAEVACLRFYRWSKPTLSLGYFQTYNDRQKHLPSLACAAVRRLTGGGAILHDAELTYSIVLPRTHPLAAQRDKLYHAIHGCLIEALKRLGITAQLCVAADKIERPSQKPSSPSGRGAEAKGGPIDPISSHYPLSEGEGGPFQTFRIASETAGEPFLCFQRRSPGDVMIGQTKICGSAQRRRNGAVLQHGSLLWRTSPAAPELPGVVDIVTHPIEMEILAELWLSGLSRRLCFSWQLDDLNEKEVSQAETLVESRYAWDDWTKNRASMAHCGQETL